MQNKQEALQVLLATYSKLKSLYAEHLELEEDAAEEDRLLFDKVGRLYDKLVKKKPEAPDEDEAGEVPVLAETYNPENINSGLYSIKNNKLYITWTYVYAKYWRQIFYNRTGGKNGVLYQ